MAGDNQEFQRTQSNSVVDDRTLYEIYLPAFKAAVVEGNAWSIMGSYNLYNGQFNCHNKKLLVDILKGEWGFDGVVVSDWGGCRDDEEAVINGLDIEMGTWTNGLREGKYTTKELDDKVSRILRLIFRTSMRPEPNYGRFVCPEHYQAARDISAAGVVLLKNENNVLPLNVPEGGKILLVGENVVKKMVVGGGSSNLKTAYEVNPLEGIQNAYADKAEVVWARGYVGDTSTSYNLVDTGQDLKDNRSPKELIAEAVEQAKDADYVIFIGGPIKTEAQYPGVKEEGDKFWQTHYSEGVYVGYRWYSTQEIPVQFAFGHGLSYTTFDYSNAKSAKTVMKSGSTLKVSVDVENTGKCDGAEVVQLYIADPESSVDRPVRELKGFEKVWLKAGEKKTVVFEIDAAALSYFDAYQHAWIAEPGEFKALFGSSSEDIKSEVTFYLK